jgi:hypothetical protein
MDDGLNLPLTPQQVDIAMRWWRCQMELASADRLRRVTQADLECFSSALFVVLCGKDAEYLSRFPWHPPGHHMHLSVHEGHANTPLTWAARELIRGGSTEIFPRHAAMHVMARFRPEGRVYAGRYGWAVEITADMTPDTFPIVQYAVSVRGKSRSR